MAGWHVSVSGLMGSGKTTLVRSLAEQLGGLALVERDNENPYLGRFYEEPPAWAFRNFVFFFRQTLDDYTRARRDARGGVQERVLQEHLDVFAAEFLSRGYLSEADWRVLDELTETALGLIPRPDLLIHLKVAPEEALARLRSRANPADRGVSLDYLEGLEKRYSSFVAAWDGVVLEVDGTMSDFRGGDDVFEFAEVVREHLRAQCAC